MLIIITNRTVGCLTETNTYLIYVLCKQMVNVLLKILTHTNVIALIMLPEIGAYINYFSQNSQNTCSKSIVVGNPIFFYHAMRIYICTTLNNIPSICWFLKKSHKCISKHQLFCLKIDLLVLTKCSFDFWFVYSFSLFS